MDNPEKLAAFGNTKNKAKTNKAKNTTQHVLNITMRKVKKHNKTNNWRLRRTEHRFMRKSKSKLRISFNSNYRGY